MNLLTLEAKETAWLTCNNESAAEFLRLWRTYVHGIDDIIDGDTKDFEGVIRVFMQAAFVYSHPFYLSNLPSLRQIAINCTNAYADSVRWERDSEEWKRNFSDHYRHFAAEMVIAIAFLCGGYDHMRAASVMLRELCWCEHHNDKGELT